MKKLLYLVLLFVIIFVMSSCLVNSKSNFPTISGFWINNTNLYNIAGKDYFEINSSEGKLSGSYYKYDIFQESYEEYDLKGEISDKSLIFYYEYNFNGSNVKISFDGELNDDEIIGTITQFANGVEITKGSFQSEYFGEEIYAELIIDLTYPEVKQDLSNNKSPQKVSIRKTSESEPKEYLIEDNKVSIKISDFDEYIFYVYTGHDFEDYKETKVISFPKKYKVSLKPDYSWGVIYTKVNDLERWDEAYLEYVYRGSGFSIIEKIDIKNAEQKNYIPAETYYDITLYRANENTIISSNSYLSLDQQEIYYMGDW